MPLRRSVADIDGPPEAALVSPAARAGGVGATAIRNITPMQTASTCRFMVCHPFPPGPTRTSTDVIIATTPGAQVDPRSGPISRSIEPGSDIDERGISRATFLETDGLPDGLAVPVPVPGGDFRSLVPGRE